MEPRQVFSYIAPMDDDLPPGAAPGKPLTPEARRALAEAEARHQAAAQAEAEAAGAIPEDGGPKGPEPTRFGDWERKGIAVDF